MNPGDHVQVSFDGLEHQGVVERLVGKGWVRCRIRIDPEADYGSITSRLTPETVVCVRESEVRHAEE